MIIEKKVLPKYFQKILDGDKTFEVRLADFECKEGDILALKEWDDSSQSYTGRALEKKITFIVKTKDLDFWEQEEIDKFGYQVIGFK